MMKLLFTLSDLQIYSALELKDFTQDIHAENDIEKIVIQASGGRYRLSVNGSFVNLYETQESLVEVLLEPEKRMKLSKVSDLSKNEQHDNV